MATPVKPTPDDLKLWASIETEPSGTFKMFQGGINIEANIQGHIRNADEISARARNAFEHECFIEVIALEQQVIDYWLRLFVANTVGDPDRPRAQFGQRIELAGQHGFDGAT